MVAKFFGSIVASSGLKLGLTASFLGFTCEGEIDLRTDLSGYF